MRIPDLADVFIRREIAEGLEATGKVVGGHEIAKMDAQLVVAVVRETLGGRFFDCAIYPLDLTIDPRVIWLGQPMLGLICLTVSQHLARLRDAGLIATRSVRQTILYRIEDPSVQEMINALYRIYCAP